MAALEVIVVDDGSTDSSRERLAAYDGDPRVRLHTQSNLGAHAALNRGLELARGEVVFILDSDDRFDPRRIARLAEGLAASPDAGIAASHLEIIDAGGARVGVKHAWRDLPPWPAPTPGPYLSDEDDPRLALLETNWISTTSNLAIRRSLVHEHGLRFAPLRYAHDWDFALAACRHGAVVLVEEPLVGYRVHGANTIGEGDDAARGAMRFEIMWVVARHAARLIRDLADDEVERSRWTERLWLSAPTFGREAIFSALLALRGADPQPPPAYDALLDPAHPFHRAAVDELGR